MVWYGDFLFLTITPFFLWWKYVFEYDVISSEIWIYDMWIIFRFYNIQKIAINHCKQKKIPYFFRNTGFNLLAEWERFELSRAFYTPTPLAGEPLRPLGYHSESKVQYKGEVAERVGFEPTAHCCVTGFQDQLLKPLGHLSECASIFYHGKTDLSTINVQNFFFLSKTFRPGEQIALRWRWSATNLRAKHRSDNTKNRWWDTDTANWSNV